jgi:hypothetical protein
MKFGLCLIIKNENQYLDEWLNYHRTIGIDNFFIYDNNSDTPININDSDVSIIPWSDNQIGSQSRAYQHCCSNFNSFDFIGFIDTDEFYESKSMKIKEDFSNLTEKYGEFNGVGVYWRFYGQPQPYFNNRASINEYVYYHNNGHIKSFLNPSKVKNFPDPHRAIILGKYIDELGRDILGPIGNHTSDFFWIKHTWTRSLEEFNEKIKRGSGDKVIRNYTLNDFYNYNNNCYLK